MARSTYVYVLMNNVTGCLVASFTVKYEMVFYVKDRLPGTPISSYDFIRCRDGGRSEPICMTWDEVCK